MAVRVKIECDGMEAVGVLNDTEMAKRIAAALPIEARVNRWGEEIYFEIPVSAALARDAAELVSVGDLGYWPPGRAFCIFFGKTPASSGDQPEAASPVNLVGRIEGDARVFSAVPDGAKITMVPTG
jgi:hypothetical protein